MRREIPKRIQSFSLFQSGLLDVRGRPDRRGIRKALRLDANVFVHASAPRRCDATTLVPINHVSGEHFPCQGKIALNAYGVSKNIQ
jgi:hypothetical protein